MDFVVFGYVHILAGFDDVCILGNLAHVMQFWWMSGCAMYVLFYPAGDKTEAWTDYQHITLFTF